MTHWDAAFIAAPRAAILPDPEPADYFRHEFDVTDGLRSAQLHVTSIGVVEARIDGNVVGDEVLIPTWTVYSDRVRVSTFDVTDRLAAGRHCVGAIVGEGWGVGRMGYFHTPHVWSDRPLLFVQIELRYDDRTEVIGTDATWRVGRGAVGVNGIYEGETFDARDEQHGWALPGFDDSHWASAELAHWNLETLFHTDVEPIRRIDTLPVAEVIHTPAGRTVVDFGQNFSGWVRFTLDAPAGTTVTLRHTEVMVHGEPDFETNRGAAAMDHFTHDGSGPITWEPRLTFHGFRYVEVEGWPGTLDPAAFTAVVIHTDMTRTGWWECSNPLLSQFHRNVVWSTRGNFVGLPTDCPQRDERLGWTGDINAFAPTASFIYDVRGILSSWLEDLAADHRRIGFVPVFSPDLLAEFPEPTALWSDVVISLPWHLYQEYGDVAVLERQYPSMVAHMTACEAMLDERDLITHGFQFGDWVDPDAPPTAPAAAKTNPYLIAGVFLARTTRELAETARVLGHDDDAARYAALHTRVHDAFRREWMSASGRLVNETATAYALAICHGLFDSDQLQYAGSRLASIVAWGRFTITTGFAGTPAVMPALTRTGHVDLAYRMMLDTSCPSVLYPLSMGATTIWERWDAVRPDGTLNSTGMTSLNHYALGAVAEWLHETVTGLQRADVAYAAVRIAPVPGGGLTSARAVRDTPQGRVEVQWSLDGAELELRAVTPTGVRTTVVLPQHPDGLVEEYDGGERTWRYTMARPSVATYDLDTPLTELRRDRRVWPLVLDALARYSLLQTGGAAFEGVMVKRRLSDFMHPALPNPALENALRVALGHDDHVGVGE